LHELHEVHEFNGCFDPQCDLQLIAEAKRGPFIDRIALYGLHLNVSFIDVHELRTCSGRVFLENKCYTCVHQNPR
jgi:hypothetical protein